MTEKKTFSLETAMYLFALVVALSIRLIGLGSVPFNETEASWAWQAYQVSKSEPVMIGSQPAYVMLTSLVFTLFSSSEALARMLPAIFGGMVVLLPYTFREEIGRKAALIAAFGLALDPVMAAVSRQVGSPMMAVGFTVLALFFWKQAKPGFSGVFAALVLLSGLPAVTLFLGLVVTISLLVVSGFRQGWGEGPSGGFKPFLICIGLTLFSLGTLWMREPQGLSAMMQALPDYLAGWRASSPTFRQVPSLQVLAALPLYQPIGLFFWFAAVMRTKTWEQHTKRFLALFGVVVLALIAAYPSRQSADLVWALPVIWLLTGVELAPLLKPIEKKDRVVVWGQAITILAMLSFWWVRIVSTTRIYFVNIPEGFRPRDFGTLDFATRDYLLSMVIFLVVPVAIGLLAVIVIASWSKQLALQGYLRGLGIFAIFYVVMVLFGIDDLRPQQANELWSPVMSAGYADDLRNALAELSEPSVGNRDELEVVYTLDLALLHWQLRDMPNAHYAAVLNPNETPAVIIEDLSSVEEMNASDNYRGEKIALQLSRSWGERVLPQDFDRWFIFREAPLEKQWIVLWAREDIFIGYQDIETGTGEPVE
jgi:4-amino-4-deoxy-L-arabinose transferase-like glycosyltransferase